MVFGREWKNKTEQANNIITRCKLLGLGKWIYHPQKQWVGKRKLKNPGAFELVKKGTNLWVQNKKIGDYIAFSTLNNKCSAVEGQAAAVEKWGDEYDKDYFMTGIRTPPKQTKKENKENYNLFQSWLKQPSKKTESAWDNDEAMFEKISNIDPTVLSLAERNIKRQNKTLGMMQKQEMEETQKLINTIVKKVLKIKPDADMEKLMDKLNSYSFEKLVNLASDKGQKQEGGFCCSCGKRKYGGAHCYKKNNKTGGAHCYKKNNKTGGDGYTYNFKNPVANSPIVIKY